MSVPLPPPRTVDRPNARKEDERRSLAAPRCLDLTDTNAEVRRNLIEIDRMLKAGEPPPPKPQNLLRNENVSVLIPPS